MRLQQTLRRSDGFTLIEVLVAAVILVVAFTSLAAIFIGGQNEASAEVEQSQLINIADQQIEQIRAATTVPGGFAALGLDKAPSTDTTPSVMENLTYTNPNNFTFAPSSTGSGAPSACFDINVNYDNIVASQYSSEVPTGFTPWSYCGSYGEPLTVLGSSSTPLIEQGSVAATGIASSACPSQGSSAQIYSPCSVQESANTTFNVYTFVTDTYVGCGSTNGGTTCPTVSSGQVSGCTFTAGTASGNVSATQSNACADSRRVTVAVVPVTYTNASTHKQLARVTPVYVSTVFTNPTPTTGTVNPVGITLGASL